MTNCRCAPTPRPPSPLWLGWHTRVAAPRPRAAARGRRRCRRSRSGSWGQGDGDGAHVAQVPAAAPRAGHLRSTYRMPIRSATPKRIHCALFESAPPPPERASGRASSGGSPGRAADVVRRTRRTSRALCLGCQREQRGEEQEQSKASRAKLSHRRGGSSPSACERARMRRTRQGWRRPRQPGGAAYPVAGRGGRTGCNGEDDQQSGGKQRGRGRGGRNRAHRRFPISPTCCRSPSTRRSSGW